MINEQIFRQWWYVFHGDDKLVELRLIGTINGRDTTLSGYFTDYQTALQAVLQYGEGVNVFSPFNPIIEACSNRQQLNYFKKLGQKENSTSDNDISSRRWIMIDFDPNRPAGTNSTEDEKTKAYNLMLRVGVFLRDQGFTSPIVAMSGNGYHCYYRVNLPNNNECRILCENFLHSIELMFGDETCDIDVSVANAARITKVIGSVAYKGRDTSDRPCRLSHFVKVPEEIEPTPVEMIQKVAGMIPKKEIPSRYNGYGESFDIDAFISNHGIEVSSIKPYKDGGRKIILAHCPFNPEHKAPDSAIFVGRDGAIGFRCLHNSCANYNWRDVRIHFEPDAYSQRDREAYERKRDYNSTQPRPAPVVIDEDDEKGKKWLSMKEIEWQDPSLLTYIPTEIIKIDKEIGGLCLGDVTIISGLSGAGKSTILNKFILSAIQHGYKCAIWSGELSPNRFKTWLNQAAAGANFLQKSIGATGKEYYYCPKNVATKIDAWTEGKLFLYNNNYGNHSSQILQDVRNCVKEHGTQLLIFDNKMAMSLDSWEGDKNEREAGLINELAQFAKMSQLHVILVCHPRKEMLNSLLRMQSIAGNSDLYNCASNVFLCHRVNRDFERCAKDFFGRDFIDDVLDKKYDEVVEVAKNRSDGPNVVTGLYYEKKTRRYLNDIAEYTIYGWQGDEIPPVDNMADTRQSNDYWGEQNEIDDLPD